MDLIQYIIILLTLWLIVGLLWILDREVLKWKELLTNYKMILMNFTIILNSGSNMKKYVAVVKNML